MSTLDDYVKLRRENAVATIMLIGQHREAKANTDAMKELALVAVSGGAWVELPPPPHAALAAVLGGQRGVSERALASFGRSQRLR